MKINIRIGKVVKQKNNNCNEKNDENNVNNKIRSANTKEYKIDTKNITAKFKVEDDNVLKLENAEIKKRTGDKSDGNSQLMLYISNFFRNKNKISKNYYMLLIAMIVLALSSTILVIKNYHFTDLEDYITYSLDEEVTAVSSSIDTGTIEEAVLKEEETSVTNVVVKSAQNEEVIPKLEFSSPMQGEISKIYSPDKVIYSKTLELWKTHDGIDIKGEIGQNVFAIEKGKVSKVYNDSFLGYTVVLDHGQGYVSAYSNLSENIPVGVGEIVTKGQIIGQISTSAIGEIKDDVHLHFTLMKDNEIVDPTYVTKN